VRNQAPAQTQDSAIQGCFIVAKEVRVVRRTIPVNARQAGNKHQHLVSCQR